MRRVNMSDAERAFNLIRSINYKLVIDLRFGIGGYPGK